MARSTVVAGSSTTRSASTKSPPSSIRSVTNVHRLMGNKLRTLRIAREMSQQALGEALGISFQQIQKYERGGNRIDAARLIDIAKALDVDIGEFYDDLTDRRVKSGPTEREVFLATREGRQIVDAMIAITHVGVRRRIIALAETLGGLTIESEDDDGE